MMLRFVSMLNTAVEAAAEAEEEDGRSSWGIACKVSLRKQTRTIFISTTIQEKIDAKIPAIGDQ